jgi:hypothetical protein
LDDALQRGSGTQASAQTSDGSRIATPVVGTASPGLVIGSAPGGSARHAIQTGSLVGNKTFLWATHRCLRPREDYELPVDAYLLEHSQESIMIDAGLGKRYPPFGPMRRVLPIQGKPWQTTGFPQ